MSKYKIGDQFWFEIADVYEAGGKTIYDCSNGGFCVDPILDGFERLDPDEKANADYDAGYAEGLDAAWEAARKMVNSKGDGGLGFKEMKDIFGTASPTTAFNMHIASEAISKIQDYEKKKKARRLRSCWKR